MTKTSNRPMFGEIPRDEWVEKPQVERDLLLFEALLTGAWVLPRISSEDCHYLPSNILQYVRTWTVQGFIIGWEPVLSPKGIEFLNGLRSAVKALEQSPQH